MDIALTFDRNYLTPAYVLLTSVLANNPHKITFHIIATGLTDIEKTELDLFFSERGLAVRFYSVDVEDLRKKIFIKPGSYFSLANYYRLFFPLLIDPNIKKLLYLDVDMVVIKDLAPLYEVSFNEAIAAVQDPYLTVRTDLGLTCKEQYFNTGVLLMNNAVWREQNLTERAIQFAVENPDKVRFVDQDALNAVLKGAWHHLDKRYNLTRGDLSIQVPTKTLLKDVVIVHYNTSEKPWHCLARNKLRFLYHKYQKRSPAKGKKYVDFNVRKLKDFLRIRMKETFFNWRLNTVIPIWRNIGGNY